MQEKIEVEASNEIDAPENGVSASQEKRVKAQAAKKNKEHEQANEPEVKLPLAVMLYKHFVLSLKMPGQSAHINMYHTQGKKVYDPEVIKLLIEHNAPIVDISKEIQG